MAEHQDTAWHFGSFGSSTESTTLQRTLLLGLLAGNVLLRFFTNYLQILPHVLNIWDLGVTYALAGLAISKPGTLELPVDTGKWLRRLLLFNAVCLIGSLLNTRYVCLLPFFSQLLMWNEPIILFLAVVHLPFSLEDIGRFRRLLLFLIGLEIIIGVLQVPIYLKTGESESIIGTFAGDGEQYQFFILIGLFFLLARFQAREEGNGKNVTAIFFIFILVILIDNKASWVALTVALTIVLHKLPKLSGHFVKRSRAYVMLAAMLLVGWFTVTMASKSYSSKYGALYEGIATGNLTNLGKIKGLRDVIAAYKSNVQMLFVGAGLGTFYSRAATQFFPFNITKMYNSYSDISQIAKMYNSQPNTSQTSRASASMSGVFAPIFNVKPFYMTFYDREQIFSVGSGTVDDPNSSYTSLLGETGVLGTILYLGFWVFALRLAWLNVSFGKGDNSISPFAVATYGSFVYLMCMACYGNWMDNGRLSTIVWSMLALMVRYKAMADQKDNLGAADKT